MYTLIWVEVQWEKLTSFEPKKCGDMGKLNFNYWVQQGVGLFC